MGLAGSYAAALAAWTTGTATGSGLAGSSSAFILSGGAVEATGVAGLVAGPVVIILIAIAIGVAAGVPAQLPGLLQSVEYPEDDTDPRDE